MPYSVPITSQSIYVVSLLCPKTSPARPKASPPPKRCLQGTGAHIPPAPAPHPIALSTRPCCLWSPGQGTWGLVMTARKRPTPKHGEHGHQGGLHSDPFGDTNSPPPSPKHFLHPYGVPRAHTVPKGQRQQSQEASSPPGPTRGDKSLGHPCVPVAVATWLGVPTGAQMSSRLNGLFIQEHQCRPPVPATAPPCPPHPKGSHPQRVRATVPSGVPIPPNTSGRLEPGHRAPALPIAETPTAVTRAPRCRAAESSPESPPLRVPAAGLVPVRVPMAGISRQGRCSCTG